MSVDKLAIPAAALVAISSSALVVQGSDGESDLRSSLRNIPDYIEAGSKVSKFGGKYASYFMDPEHNISKWRAKLEEMVENEDGHFKDVEDVQALKKKCIEKYNADSETDSTKLNKIWKYCSFGDEEPSTISGSSTAIGSISEAAQEKAYTATGGNGTNKFGKLLKSEVLSTHNPKNDWFWDIRDEDFKAGRLDGGSSTTSSYFNKTENKTIKILCREAYEKTSDNNGETNPTQDEIKKYCSLSKTTTST